ncbi:hypothetical protein [Kribbella italica]|uniref:Uncharacterized protein n=1 Tax=Kribbella italica TaxID=1540520 RepID=A0A7W9JEI2_9ACTN|nr:hypothetical protein [Kribbella italica]MBB5840489.1 hypothetical protein [Kribbella italica]
MRKSLAALAVVGGLALLAATQAAVAHAAPAAVSEVKVAWAEPGKVKISWTEAAGIANDVYLEVSGQQAQRIGTTTAGGANELVVPVAALKPSHDAASTARILVADPSTAGARSASFDRYVQGETPMLPGMVRGVMQWQFEADPATDTTPNDPLDSTAPAKITPRLTRVKAGTAAQCENVSLPATTERYGKVPAQNGAYSVDLVLANEWGESKLTTVRARTAAVAFSTPATGIYGAKVTMTGSIALSKLKNPAAGDCTLTPDTADLVQHTMALHGRNSATSAWYSIGSSWTDAKGNYKFVITNTGAREYRPILVESFVGHGAVIYQTIGATKAIRATPQVLDARFLDSDIALGQQPNATVTVAPYGSHQVALQFKNSSGQWQGLMYRTLANGTAQSGPFAFNRAGTHQFRWWVAASISAQGLPVDAGYTHPFTLTVR